MLTEQSKNKYRKLVRNTLIFGIGTFSSKILVILMMPFYTGILSPEQYGIADIITQTANLIIPLAALGICDGIFRFAMDKEGRRETLSTSIAILLLGTVAFALLSPLLSLADMYDGYVTLIVAYVIAANLHSACAQYVRACGMIKLFAFQGILGTALTVAFNILFLIPMHMEVTGFVASIICADVITTLFVFFVARLWRDISFSEISLSKAKALLKYSIPMIPTTVFWWITNVSDRYLVTYMCGSAENGLYSAAYKIPTLITLIATVFIEAWQLSAVTDADETDRSSFFSTVFKSFCGMIFLAVSVIIAFSQIFTVILFESSYFESWEYIPLLVMATAFSALVTFMGSVYLVKKKSVMSFVTSMIGAIVNILLNIILIPVYGAQGAAFATLISYLLVFVIRAVNTRRYVKFSMKPLKLILNTLITGIQCAIMILQIDGWIFWQIGMIGLLALLNIPSIIEGIMLVVGRRKEKT